jgi:hypothetical protein
MEFQGQLWGGPEHGNIVSTTVEHFRYEATTWMWLDGGYKAPSINEVSGTYKWNPEMSRFDWDGPGADGDTLERLRRG